MATLRNKRKLAAVTRETQKEHPRNGQSRNTYVPRINEEYITQFFEEIEGRGTKKLSQEFSRTESRILGALSKLDEFFLNQQITTHSGTVPGTFRNTNVENQRTDEDDSQSDPHPEASIFRSQTTQNSGPEVGHDMVTRVQKESLCGHDTVTGVGSPNDPCPEAMISCHHSGSLISSEVEECLDTIIGTKLQTKSVFYEICCTSQHNQDDNGLIVTNSKKLSTRK